MIVDSSALIALIQNEPEAEQVAAALAGARSPVISAATLTETLTVLTARRGPIARTVLERLRSEIHLGIAEYTAEHANAAQRAYLHFGRARHPAGLNFGDCMSYATALLAHEPLLAIGDAFPQTDLEFGDGIIGYWPTPSTTNEHTAATRAPEPRTAAASKSTGRPVDPRVLPGSFFQQTQSERSKGSRREPRGEAAAADSALNSRP